VVSVERESRLLGCGERDPMLVLVSRATFGMDPSRQGKRLGIRFVPLALAAVVAGDRGNRGVVLLVVELFVLAVLIAMFPAFVRDRAREVELARGRAIEPANGGRWSGPDDVTTAEVVPEGKRKDEQEETDEKNHVEEGKGLENSVASVINLVRIAFNIVVYDDAIFFCPAFYISIGNGRVNGDCSKGEPDDREDANPEKFPSGLGDQTQFADTRHEEQSEAHEESDDRGEHGKWYKYQRIRGDERHLEVDRNSEDNKGPGGHDGEKGGTKDVEDRVHGDK
jgi:hypothetical protein